MSAAKITLFQRVSIGTMQRNESFILLECRGVEPLSGLFHYVLKCVPLAPPIDEQALLGQAFSVVITQAQHNTRYIHGIVVHVSQRWRAKTNVWYCFIRLRPRLYLSDKDERCRVFQDMTVPEVFAALVAPIGLDKTQYQYRIMQPRTALGAGYHVQFNESSFHFLSRILQKAGLFYYFLHSREHHQWVIVDDVSALPVLADACPSIRHWQHTSTLTPTSFATTDYHPLASQLDLACEQSLGASSQPALTWFDYPGNHETGKAGEASLQQKKNRARIEGHYITGVSDSLNLSAGTVFTHQHSRYYITHHALRVWDYTAYPQALHPSGQALSGGVNRFRALSMQQPFVPPVTTKRPIIKGYQVARVVPSAATCRHAVAGKKPPLHTVSLRFAWDMRKDQRESACCVRVSEALCQQGYGYQFPPRVGDSVVVAFVHGDPTRPIIIGQYYHPHNTPPFALPAQQALSGFNIKPDDTHSTRCHQCVFDDTPGQEKYHLCSRQDFHFHTQRHYRMTVHQHQHTDVTGDLSICSVNAHYRYEASTSLCLGVGKNRLRLTPHNIHVQGARIHLN